MLLNWEDEIIIKIIIIILYLFKHSPYSFVIFSSSLRVVFHQLYSNQSVLYILNGTIYVSFDDFANCSLLKIDLVHLLKLNSILMSSLKPPVNCSLLKIDLVHLLYSILMSSFGTFVELNSDFANCSLLKIDLVHLLNSILMSSFGTSVELNSDVVIKTFIDSE